jgi:hypothetical protein
MQQLFIQFIDCVVSSGVVHAPRPEKQHAPPRYYIELNISQKALGTLPEDGNVMPKHVGTTIHN